MHTISATDLARNTREILDRVSTRGETVGVERNQALIVKIVPADPTMTASEAMRGLPPANLTLAQASAWLKDSQEGFDETVLNPWG